MAPPSPPIDEWLASLPVWLQYVVQGSKLMLAFSPIFVLIVILVRAFESDEEVRPDGIGCCEPRGLVRTIHDLARVLFLGRAGGFEAKKEDRFPGSIDRRLMTSVVCEE